MVLALLIFDTSQAQDKIRYTQKAPEIEIAKSVYEAYSKGDWAKMKSFYAADAVITHNESGKLSISDLAVGLQSTASDFSSYQLTLNGEEERVVNDKGQTWVNAWGDWKGTRKETGEAISMPVHVTLRFEKGKIVEEHAYYNVAVMYAAAQNFNKSIVQGIYDNFAKGDVPAVLAAMDEKVVWNEAEGNKYADGNPYIGPNAVLEGVFARLGADHEYFKLQDIQLSAMGDNKVLATLRYDAKWKNGEAYNSQTAHLWTLNNGKITAFQQYTNTKLLADAEQ